MCSMPSNGESMETNKRLDQVLAALAQDKKSNSRLDSRRLRLYYLRRLEFVGNSYTDIICF